MEDSGDIQTKYIQDLETKVREMDQINLKLNRKLAMVQTNYEKIDQFYDKTLSLLTRDQTKELEEFIENFHN